MTIPELRSFSKVGLGGKGETERPDARRKLEREEGAASVAMPPLEPKGDGF